MPTKVTKKTPAKQDKKKESQEKEVKASSKKQEVSSKEKVAKKTTKSQQELKNSEVKELKEEKRASVKQTKEPAKKAEKTVKKETVKSADKTEKKAPVKSEKKSTPPTENKLDESLALQVVKETLFEKTAVHELKNLTELPESMEELFAKTGYQLQGLKKGQEVKATITDKNKKTLFFDIGAKTEGILLEKEMEFVEDYIRFLNVGDVVKAVVVSPENEKGQILISLSRAANDWKWSLFQKYMDTGETVEVRGLDINRGGMIARLMNVRGFIPVSQFGRQWMGKLDQLYNKVFPVKVIEVDREKNRLIFSEKSVSEAETISHQQDMLTTVKVGNKYKGQVSGVMPFGIFVRVFLEEDQEIGAFLDGLVHISELSWEKVNDVSKIYKMGDMVTVQVIDVDRNTGKLNLSIKRLSGDPWDDIASRFPVDAKVKGKVTRLAAFGAFVEIEKGIEGLIHVSKFPSDMDIKAGDEVDVYIESLDKENHRISLGVVLSAKPVGYK